MPNIYLKPIQWEGDFKVPALKDIRWKVAGLLATYLILGVSFLGFSRKPFQIITVILLGMVLDVTMRLLFTGKKEFPLSAIISCLSLSILLNYTLGFTWIWIPVFITIGSKYLLTYKGKHIFNPSLFGICISLLISHELITLSPSYQWYGAAESAYAAGIFMVTASIFIFLFKIKRNYLIFSFLFFFFVQAIIRAVILQHVIPPSTLILSSLVTPSFYLFTFYMITDPATSPLGKWDQIITGFLIAAIDLYLHTKFNLFTFFYAGLAVGALRIAFKIFKDIYDKNPSKWSANKLWRVLVRYPITACMAIPLFFLFTYPNTYFQKSELSDIHFSRISEAHSGIKAEKSNIYDEVDPRLQHVSKWLLSVGDGIACADVDLDGDQDLFFNQSLKSTEWQNKLYINEGDFKFTKRKIAPLEQYLGDHKSHGIPAFAFFYDMDNDGDKDLFAGRGYGKNRIFENHIIPDDSLYFTEVPNEFLSSNNSVCLSANIIDINKDAKPDLVIANAMCSNLPDYEEKTPFNIFDLPQPAYEGDRRMLHFMHESWHNANNGWENFVLLQKPDGSYETLDNSAIGMPETRWSLAVGTADFNQDGWTDLYIANDFGRDDCYMNNGDNTFSRQHGVYYGELGLDTYKGMNTSIADFDDNQREDIYISNVHHALQAEGSLLWMNYSDSLAKNFTFREEAGRKSLLNINRFGWGGASADMDLDGNIDVIQANGMVGVEWDSIYDKRMDYWYFQAQIARTGPEIHSYADKWADLRGMSIYEYEGDRIFLNKGSHFEDFSELLGITHQKNTRAAAPIDLDNDGDLDLIFSDQFGAPIIYKNELEGHHWVGFEVKGDGKHACVDAVGTKLYLHYTLQGKKYTKYREIRSVNGFSAQDDIREVFGFGEEIPENLSLDILWPDGLRQNIRDFDIDKYYEIIPKKSPQ